MLFQIASRLYTWDLWPGALLKLKLGRPGSRTGGRMRLCGLGGRAESGQFGIGNWRFCGGLEIS